MKILITTSTLPMSENDKVPAFVRDQAMELKKEFPNLTLLMHAPHNAYSCTANINKESDFYESHRFHYFWPFKYELLVGRGIMPALRKNKFLYLQIPFLVISQFFSLLRLVGREKPDLIYAHWFTPQAIIAALVSKITGTPFLFTTHASDVSVLKKLPLSKKLVAWVCRSSAAYFAVSERTSDKLEAFFSEQEWGEQYSKKLSIIPMGVKTKVITPSKEKLEYFKQYFSLPSKKINILFLGRLAEKKGVLYLLEAVSLLPLELRQKLNIIIAGDGQLKHQLMNYAAKSGLDNVIFTGYVTGDAKAALINIADYTCFPSIIDDSGDAEGFPVAIMECLAAGKIVLASNVTGAEDVIIQRNAGFVFKEQSAEDLVHVIKQALKLNLEDKSQVCQNAINLAAQFDWKLITERHYNIFKKVLKI